MKKVGVIGAGPGGYVAAIRLAQLGADVHLFEKGSVGGTCLNRGCIPTKTYFRTAEIMHSLKRAEEFAIDVADNAKVDGKKLQDRKKSVVETLVSGIEQLISAYPNMKLYRGLAQIENASSIKVNGEVIDGFDAIIIASGSRPMLTETQGTDLEGVITSDELLELEKIPKRLIVVGGGVIGLEFASIYKELGSEVVVLASRILKNADSEIAKRLVPLLKKQGIELYNDVRAKNISKKGEMIEIEFASKKTDDRSFVQGDYVLLASGRGPVYEGLKLDKNDIAHDKSGIIVDENFETSLKNVYAIGDIVKDNPQLAHVASAQGEFVAGLIMGRKEDINLAAYPNCVFTLNEVAHVGMTEDEIKEKQIEYKVSKFNFAANGKALCLGEGNGLVKVLTDKEGKLLGVHILGPHANDLIAECTLALANNMDVDDLLRAIHAHPTLSETIAEASAAIFDKAIHIAPLRKKK